MEGRTKAKTVLYLVMLLLLVWLPCSFIHQVLTIPSVITATWQTVCVDNVCTFKVPAWWVVEQQNGEIWITDRPRSEEGYRLIAVGVVISDRTDYQYSEPNELLEGVVKGDSHGGVGYSNSAGYMVFDYFENSHSIRRYLVDFHFNYSDKGWVMVKLLVWDKGFFL